MLIIPVKEGENIDRALKRYKRKFDRTKTMKNLFLIYHNLFLFRYRYDKSTI